MLVIAGIIGTVTTVVGEMPTLAIFLSAAALPAGKGFFILGQYREKIIPPVPSYTLIKTAAEKKLDVAKELVDAIEKELRESGERVKAGKQRAAFFLKHSYEALGICDYIRAHITARFCLGQEKKSIPGHLALAVAGSALKQNQQVIEALRFVQQRTGMKGSSDCLGRRLGLAQIGDWAYAEIFLDQARRTKPSDPTILSLLSIAQLRRGKLFSAISSARKARNLRPEEKVYTKLLIDLLLQGGFLREAHEYLHPLAEEAMTDQELTMAMATLCLSQRNLPIAEQWMEVVLQNDAGPKKFVQLGQMCETARHDQKASELFQHALTHGHYPEALFGLGRLEAHRQNHHEARTHFIAALDLERPAAENSTGAALWLHRFSSVCTSWRNLSPAAGLGL